MGLIFKCQPWMPNLTQNIYRKIMKMVRSHELLMLRQLTSFTLRLKMANVEIFVFFTQFVSSVWPDFHLRYDNLNVENMTQWTVQLLFRMLLVAFAIWICWIFSFQSFVVELSFQFTENFDANEHRDGATAYIAPAAIYLLSSNWRWIISAPFYGTVYSSWMCHTTISKPHFRLSQFGM